MDNILEIDEQKKQKAYRVLSSVYNLPSVPFIIFEVSKVIEDPSASAAQLGRIISRDQGLVTKILSVANSPLYGIPRRVSTIDFAIVILGFNHIKNIVIALSMMEAFKKFGDKKFDQKKYWLHSIVTASAAKRIADDLGYATSGEAFTAGLLHDLGIPIIYKYFPKEFQLIEKTVKENGISFLQAEQEVLGITHQEVGKFLMDKWNLPLALSDVIDNHHKPSQAQEDVVDLASLVHLADYMTDRLGIGNFDWDEGMELDESVLTTLKLGDTEYLNNFVESYRELFENQIETIKF